MARIVNQIQFFSFKYLKTSKKALLYSSIGLILTLSLIISSMYYTTAQFDSQLQNELESYKNPVQNSNYFYGYNPNERSGSAHYDLGIGAYFSVILNDNNSNINLEELKSSFMSNYQSFVNNNSLNEYISSVQVFIWNNFFMSFFKDGNFVHDQLVNTSEFKAENYKEFLVLEENSYYLDLFSQLGDNITLNSEDQAVYVHINQETSSNTDNITLYGHDINSTFKLVKNYKIINEFNLDSKFLPLNNPFNDILIIKSVSELSSHFNKQVYSTFINPVLLSKVESMNSDEFITFNTKIDGIHLLDNEFIKIGSNLLGPNLLNNPSFYNEINILYSRFNNKVVSQFYFMLVAIFPFVLIGIFITNYSFNLLAQPLLQKLENFKLRGSSRKLIVSILTTESFSILIISAVVGFIVSYFFAYIGLQANSYLSITFGNFPVIRFNSLVIPALIVYLFVLFLINSVPRIISYSKFESGSYDGLINEKEPYWKRHNIDLIIIFIPLLLILLYFLSSQFISAENLAPYSNLAFILPFILVLGLFMATGRILNYLIIKLSVLVKKSTKINLKMSIHLLNGVNKSLMRGFIIITLLIFITNFFCIITVSLESDMISKEYLNQGFDFKGESSGYYYGEHINESYYNEIITSIYSNHQGKITQPVIIKAFYYNDQNEGTTGIPSIKFYVMNISQAIDSFSKNIDISSFLPGFTSKQLVSSLTYTKGKIPILIHEPSIKDSVIVDQNGFSINSTEFEIVRGIVHFPDVVETYYSGGISPIPVIVDDSAFDKIENLVNSSFLREERIIFGFNFKNSLNENVEISKNLFSNYSYSEMEFNSIPLKLDLFRNSPSNIILWGELLLIISESILMLVIIIILFFSNFYNQLKPIFYLEKSLGGSNTQIFKQMFIAILFFIIISLTTGILYTIIPFQLYYYISKSNPLIITATIQIPYVLLLIIYGSILIFSVVISSIYTLKFSRLSIIEGSDVD